MSTAVVHIPADAPLEAVVLEPDRTRAVLVITLRGRVLGEAVVGVAGELSVQHQQRALAEQLGDRLWEERLLVDFARAARDPTALADPPSPTVSVVACTSGDPGRRRRLLESLDTLDPAPLETIVVSGEPGLAEARRRGTADARGDVIAFIDDDYVVDPGWLVGLGRSFADELVMAVAGYSAPVGRGGASRRAVLDVFSFAKRPRLADGNLFVRRGALADAGTGGTNAIYDHLVAAGHRFAVETAHIAWREVPHRRSGETVRANGPQTVPPPRVVQADDPRMSVAIASYNRRERLTEVLTALAAQEYPAERYEVVVVLDGSADGSAERVRALELPYRVHLIEQENRGLAASRNRGWHEASAPVVVFLDDDIVPDPGFAAAHAAAHRLSLQPAVALGTCPPATLGDDLLSIRMRHFWADYYRRRSEPDHRWTYVDFGDGNVSFPATVLRESGGWDERFARETIRRQDWELGIRLLESGVRFIDCPNARGLHHFDPSFATALRNRRVEGRSDVLLATKHPQVRGHLFLVALMRAAAASRRSSYRFTLRYPRAASRLLAPAPQVARAIEAASLHSLAWRAIPKLLANEYLAGIRDALPTREQFRDFVEPIETGTAFERVPLHLDRPYSLDLPGVIGALELELHYGDAPVARVEALEPEMHWDWDALAERVVRNALGAFRDALANDRGDLPELSTELPVGDR